MDSERGPEQDSCKSSQIIEHAITSFQREEREARGCLRALNVKN